MYFSQYRNMHIYSEESPVSIVKLATDKIPTLLQLRILNCSSH